MNKQWAEALNRDSNSASDSKSPLSGLVTSLQAYGNSGNVEISDLSSYNIYEISGSDASDFLQGQFCNDLAIASPTQAQITGYCTPKGRLLALPTILGFDAGYRLIVPADVAEAFVKRLSMFIMRSDVTVKLLDDWIALGISAASSGSLEPLADKLEQLPTGKLAVSSSESAQLIRWHDSHLHRSTGERYLRIAKVDDQLALWQSVDEEHRHSEHTWRLADISSGIPTITQGVVEAFVPQMINLQLIDALSFTKGCYPGQEIVARMQYLGKLKRHMCIFRVQLGIEADNIDDLLLPGGSLSAGSDENAGVIVDAMPESDSSALVLAVVKVASEAGSFTLAGETLETVNMPYEMASSDDAAAVVE